MSSSAPSIAAARATAKRTTMPIDYGGYEIDDAMSAVDYLKTLPHVDQDRLGIMGWSHGGYITLLSVFRDKHPFKAAAAMVPVTNLVFRLSYKGPGYQRELLDAVADSGACRSRSASLYIERSPLYHVDKLKVPLLVHVATNDTDVNFVEDQQIVDALRVAQAGPRRDQGLRRPRSWTGERRPHVQPPRQPEDARARGFAGSARLVEPHLDVLRVEPAARYEEY